MIQKDIEDFSTEPWLLYDGDCPFCSRYVKLVRIRNTLPDLRLIDARKGGDELKIVNEARLDIDEGMVLALKGRLYHGAESIHMLALMSTPIGVFNRFNLWMFSSRFRSRLLYPVLRASRNLVLRLLGRNKLRNIQSAHNCHE